MTISKVNGKASKEIAEFFKENFADGWTEEMLNSAFLTGRFTALSLKDNGQTKGIITFSILDDTADIEDVVVKKEFRKQGVGTELIKAALKEIKALGVNRVMLEVREGNIPAIRLYEKFGFNKISLRRKYYLDGENAIVMLKE